MHAIVASLLAGVLTYVLLGLVSRSVGAQAFDQFSVFWSLALIVGFGFFLPIEQEAARLGRGSVPRRDVVAAMTVTASSLAVVVTLGMLLVTPLLVGALDLTAGLALCCVLVVLASAIQFTARGALLVNSRSRAFSNTLILDTVVRVACFALVAAVVWGFRPDDAVTWYAAALVVAIIAAHAWAFPWASWRGSAEVRRVFARAVLVLVAMNLLAQLLVNAGPVVIQAYGADTGAAGAFQASSTVARIPLAIITPIQTMLVGPLAALALAQDRSGIRRVVVRVAAAAAVLAAIGAAAGWFLGPWVVELIFGPGRALSGPEMALLIAGVIVHVALIVFTQAIVATGDHRRALVVWAVALAASAVVFFATVGSLGAVVGVELGFGVGSLAGAVLALALLTRRARAGDPRKER